MVTLNRQSLTYTLCTSPLSLLFEPCQSLTNKVVVHFLSSNIESAYHVAGYVRHEFCNYCCDVIVPQYHMQINTRFSPPYSFINWTRGEPENEAYVITTSQ